MRWLALAVLLAACGGPQRVVDHETVSVACGMCVFKMPEIRGCFWAVELDGEYWPVVGAPDDPDPHGPAGMCTAPRTAVVSGTLKDDRFLVSEWELVPYEPPPDAPVAPAHVH